MESALEAIEFLALSPNRVAVLGYLSEGTHTRRELVDLTDASQATLGRILSDFEDRSWIERDGSAYRATVTGRLVADGFGRLVDILETDAELRPVVQWLPADAITFDLTHFESATVTTPSRVRPNAPMRRATDLLSGASEVRVASYAFNEQSLDTIAERTAAGDQRFEGVFSASAIDALAEDSQLRRRLRELVSTDGASIRISEESIPVAVTVVDSVVHLLLRDDTGILQASVDMDHPEVHAWATDLFERYWETATPLTVGDL